MIAIYCRISKNKEEGKDVSIHNQKQLGIKFAKSFGEEYRFYIDESISGAEEDISKRPDFALMLNAIKNGEINKVFAIDQSRIERNNRVWNLFLAIMLDAKCEYYPNGNHIDLDVPENQFITGVLSLSNALYAALTGQKVKMAIDENTKNGKSHGINAYGYRRGKDGKLEIDDSEAVEVVKMFNKSLSGIGSYSIANDLNTRKVPTRFNKYNGQIKRVDKYTRRISTFNKANVIWRGNVVHDILKNPIYKGKRKWNGEYYDVPAIIDENLWNAVNDNLKNNKKNAGRKVEYNYLLNGLIFCEDCGCEFKGKKRPKGNDNSYKCKGKGKDRPHIICNSRGLSLPKLETFIIRHLFISKDLRTFLNGLPKSKETVSTFEKKLKKLQKQLVQYKKVEDTIYERLKNPIFKDDKRLEVDYIDIKKRIVNTEKNIEIYQQKVVEYDNSQRLVRVNKLINSYSINANFDDIKKLVHSLIKRITIKHQPKEKSGYYLLKIEYNGFDESSLFYTDWKAYKWYWLQHHREKALNAKQLEEDKEILKMLMKDKGIEEEIPDNFGGLETVSGSGADSLIEFTKDDLIIFD